MAVSRYDKKYLSPEDQEMIQYVTDEMNLYQNTGGKNGMSPDIAHNAAEKIRNDAGYSGGYDGSQYLSMNDLNTDWHQKAIDAAKNYGRTVASGGIGNWQDVVDALTKRDEKIRVTGNDGGRSTDSILDELYNMYYAPNQKTAGGQYSAAINAINSQVSKPDAYKSEWTKLAKDYVNKVLGMNYADWQKGKDYQALEDSYRYNGQRAMQDALGQVAARTGGLASSYATSAAAGQYNDYMTRLQDAARQMYDMQRNEGLQNAELVRAMENQDYGRYRDDMNQYNTDRSLYGSLFSDAANRAFSQQQAEAEAARDQRNFDEEVRQYNQNFDEGVRQYNQNFQYQVERDKVADSQWERNFNVTVDQWERTFDMQNQQNQFEALLALAQGGVSGDAIMANPKTAAWAENCGLNAGALNTIRNTYDSRIGSSGGGGGSRASSSGASVISSGGTSGVSASGNTGISGDKVTAGLKKAGWDGKSDIDPIDVTKAIKAGYFTWEDYEEWLM